MLYRQWLMDELECKQDISIIYLCLDSQASEGSSASGDTSSSASGAAGPSLAGQPRTLSSVLRRLSNILDRRSQVGLVGSRAGLHYIPVLGFFCPISIVLQLESFNAADNLTLQANTLHTAI